MFRRSLLAMTLLASVVLAGSAAQVEARGCYRGGGHGYHARAYPSYRATHYYGGPSYYRGSSAYRHNYYGSSPAYYRGGYHGGYRSGVSFSVGW
jgi:hypothetical protein